MKDVLKCVMTMSGVQSVMTHGMIQMLKLFVDKQGSQVSNCCICNAFFITITISYVQLVLPLRKVKHTLVRVLVVSGSMKCVVREVKQEFLIVLTMELDVIIVGTIKMLELLVGVSKVHFVRIPANMV